MPLPEDEMKMEDEGRESYTPEEMADYIVKMPPESGEELLAMLEKHGYGLTPSEGPMESPESSPSPEPSYDEKLPAGMDKGGIRGLTIIMARKNMAKDQMSKKKAMPEKESEDSEEEYE